MYIDKLAMSLISGCGHLPSSKNNTEKTGM